MQHASPRLLNRTPSIAADVEIPTEGAQGALVSFAGIDDNHAFFVEDGKLYLNLFADAGKMVFQSK